ncbi:MAG: class I SAM-dependent methyltransferase [Armatimonadota bacterium]|nr:class I SAM-dependent methyltransferase [Armatimonadota bacterium]
MKILDDIARINKHNWEAGGISATDAGTRPFLDVDRSAVAAYAEGKSNHLPAPFEEGYTKRITRDVQGKRVLCLASGGGQQSVLYGLLGAEVTVLDISAKQLEADHIAARHYGYHVKTIEGDMRDLSLFEKDHFHLVIQPVSIVYVPDVRVVYRQVARVLKPGGWYRNIYMNPATVPACFSGTANGWDGRGYRLSEPYRSGPILIRPDGSENMDEGEMTGEFRHLLSDIFTGLVEAGFLIREVYESAGRNEEDEPGSFGHMASTLGMFFRIDAMKAQMPDCLPAD